MGKLQLFGFSTMLNATSSKVYNKKIIKKIGNQLKVQANNLKVPSLSLLQIGQVYNLCTILKPQYIKDNRWHNYQQIDAGKYSLYANLQILDKSIATSQVWEQSPSYPGFKFMHKRAQKIKIKFDNQQMMQKVQQISGFQASIVQNQVDICEGKILLQTCEDLEVLNPQLKQKHQSIIKQQLKQYRSLKQSQNKEKIQSSEINRCFNLLKRQAIYRIIDFYRKKV